MQQAIAERAARAARLTGIPAGVVTSVDRPTARQARLYSDPAIWRGMAAVRRQVAEEERATGHEPMAARNDLIAGFYEVVGRLPRVPVPAESELAAERALLPPPRGEGHEGPRQLAAPKPIEVSRAAGGIAGALQVIRKALSDLFARPARKGGANEGAV